MFHAPLLDMYPLGMMVPVWTVFHVLVALLIVSYTRVVASDPGGVTAELGAELELPTFAPALACAMEVRGRSRFHFQRRAACATQHSTRRLSATHAPLLRPRGHI